MTPVELRAAGQLGGQAFAGMVSRVEQVHRAVADRAFGRLHEADAPARAIHDAVSRGVYGAVRGVGALAGVVSGQVASLLGAGDRPAGQAAGGNLALAAVAALNAIAGDQLSPDLAPLTIRMAARATPGSLTPGGISVAAFPCAVSRKAPGWCTQPVLPARANKTSAISGISGIRNIAEKISLANALTIVLNS